MRPALMAARWRAWDRVRGGAGEGAVGVFSGHCMLGIRVYG